MDLEIEVTTVSKFHSLDSNTSLSNNSVNHDYAHFYEKDSFDAFQDVPDILRRYDAFHYAIHGYLALTIIVIGTIGNVISMVVLTRKHMVSSTNIILSVLAFVDMMVLLTYLVKIKFHSDLAFMSHTEITYPFAMFNLFWKNCFILFHTLSTWLTVVVAIWRVMDVRYSSRTAHLRTPSRARIAVYFTALACTLVCVPEFLHYNIVSYKDDDGKDKFAIGDNEFYVQHQTLFDFFDDWGFNIILYILPCVLLAGFTFALIRNIREDRKKLEECNMLPAKYEISSRRLTLILVIILVVFLIVKVPPGIMYILDFGLGVKVIHEIHFVFAGTINTLILFNSMINFLVYLAISNRFRTVAYSVFCQNIVDKVGSLRHKPEQPIECDIELSNC